MNQKKIHEALSILHDTQELVSNSCWRDTSFEEPSFIEYMENIQREMCNIEGNFMSLLFYGKNPVELNEWLQESYLKNNYDNHKLKVQNEQLLKRLQDTCSSSYILDCHMVDDLDEIQSLFMVEEELELPLDNDYTLF